MTVMEKIEAIIAYERQFWSDLLEVDDGTPAIFEDLARRSAPYPKKVYVPRWDARSAFTPSKEMNHFYVLPEELVDEWEAYAVRWDGLLSLNPRMRIADMLSEVSEAHDSSSFPAGWEISVKNWMDSGFPPARHTIGNDIFDQEWTDRFVSASSAAGPGWVSWSDDGLRWIVQP
jgi:hypothetical protein